MIWIQLIVLLTMILIGSRLKGIGLGLMVSYNIIEAHRGTMFFESELNRGTTVNILLPLSKTARLSASMK